VLLCLATDCSFVTCSSYIAHDGLWSAPVAWITADCQALSTEDKHHQQTHASYFFKIGHPKGQPSAQQQNRKPNHTTAWVDHSTLLTKCVPAVPASWYHGRQSLKLLQTRMSVPSSTQCCAPQARAACRRRLLLPRCLVAAKRRRPTSKSMFSAPVPAKFWLRSDTACVPLARFSWSAEAPAVHTQRYK
jgi:hypothetical protein